MEKVEERIFQDHVHLTVEEIVNYINETVKSHNDLIATDDNLTRWMTVSQMSLSKEEEQKQFVEITKYIDELLLPIEDKINLITTSASILITGLLSIASIEVDSLFVLTNYLKTEDDDDYQNQLKLLGNNDLLYQVRYATLDNEKRVMLLKHMMSLAKKEKINLDDTKMVKAFQEKMKKLLTEKTANEILGLESYITLEKDIIYH